MSQRVRRPPPLRRLWYLVAAWRLKRKCAGLKLLRTFAAEHPDAFFIEVGSNDGEAGDYLHPHIPSKRWSGIMVEPVP